MAESMQEIWQKNWPNYLIEAGGLGVFMVVAGSVATILYSRASPVPNWLPSEIGRGVLMGIAMALTAISIIYSPWGKRSGAHINPAVTLAFWRLNKLTAWDAFFYILAQFLGGTLGVFLVAKLVGFAFTDSPVLCLVTTPKAGNWSGALQAEFGISFVVMLAVLGLGNTQKYAQYTGLVVGGLVFLAVLVVAPISGFSMNPARTFASAIVAHKWKSIWLYYFAPSLAMLMAAEVYLWRSKLRTRSICCKLCPNGETPCISYDCCRYCDRLIRPWRVTDQE